MTEAMACGTPVVVPGHTVFPELAGDGRGWLYPVDGHARVPELGGAERPVVPPAAILAGLRSWWRDRTALDLADAFHYVDDLGWEHVGPRWKTLFRRLAA